MKKISKYSPLRLLTLPYQMAVGLRNLMYEVGLLKSEQPNIPLICVGNIAAGGTGKTPMVEYLAAELKEQYKVAIVTRGYKRKSRGLIIADENSSSEILGDEPAQYKRKMPDVTVIVDGNRRRAINYLCSLPPTRRPDVIIMDDGFQHRSVKPHMTILLSAYDRFIMDDCLLPVGRLREPKKARMRCDLFIVTKCPNDLNKGQKEVRKRQLGLFEYQRVLFSSIQHAPIQPIFPDVVRYAQPTSAHKVFSMAGVAHPEHFTRALKKDFPNIHPLQYNDHETFDLSDIVSWENLLSHQIVQGEPCVFICTEKDAVKISDLEEQLTPELRSLFYYVPMHHDFTHDDAETLTNELQQFLKEFNQA